jgi:hypothetical protein
LPVGSSASSTEGSFTSARDGDALLLSARELIRVVLGPVRQTYCVERCPGAPTPFLGFDHTSSRVEERQLHVFDGRGPRQEIEALKHEPDRLVAHARQLVACERRDITPAEQVLSARRMVEASHNVHEGGLAGTDGPTTVTNSPAGTSSVTPRSACTT